MISVIFQQLGANNQVKFKAFATKVFITEVFPLFWAYQVNYGLPGNPAPLNLQGEKLSQIKSATVFKHIIHAEARVWGRK